MSVVSESSAASAGLILPDWPAPASVHAFVTTRRLSGVSLPPYDDGNLGDHVGDDPDAVRRNRALLQRALDLPAAPQWLQQVHGTAVFDADQKPAHDASPPVADAARTTLPSRVIAVLTADCLPILLCAEDGSEVAAVHAGWRGLAAGVIEATVDAMQTPAPRLLAWLGPAIGPGAFEVGAEVRAAFADHDAESAAAFRPHAIDAGKHWCDLYALARLRLRRLGIERASGGDLCTVSDAGRFYSHRRDRVTGRMASLIWIAE